MSHSYPPPVRLSQAFENDRGGGGVTRRTFIKRSGGATVATMVAWNLTNQQARAEQQSSSNESGSCQVELISIEIKLLEDLEPFSSNESFDTEEEAKNAGRLRAASTIYAGNPETRNSKEGCINGMTPTFEIQADEDPSVDPVEVGQDSFGNWKYSITYPESGFFLKYIFFN